MISRIEHNKFTDEYFITIPDDIVEALELEVGDTLEWKLLANGSVAISKKLKTWRYND